MAPSDKRSNVYVLIGEGPTAARDINIKRHSYHIKVHNDQTGDGGYFKRKTKDRKNKENRKCTTPER